MDNSTSNNNPPENTSEVPNPSDSSVQTPQENPTPTPPQEAVQSPAEILTQSSVEPEAPPPLDPVTPTPPVPPQPGDTTPPPANTPTDHKKGNKSLILMIVIILIIIVATVVGYVYIKKHAQPMQPAKATTIKSQSAASSELTIGVDSTYPPMESVNAKGQYVGFDIDMGNMIAKDLGEKAVWKTVVFSNIFNDLNKGDYDMVISAITITPQRELVDDFSIPYLNAGEVLIVKKTNTSADSVIQTTADFKGKTIGVQAGTTDLISADKLFPINLVKQYPSNIPALADLQSGKIDAIITDLPDAIGVIQANPTLRIATNPLDKEYYGIAFRKGDTKLKNQVNAILTNMQNSGILQQLTNKYLE